MPINVLMGSVYGTKLVSIEARVAHEQVWVKANVPVDAGIARIVELLNRIPGLQTVDSCQGDPGGRPAHVFIRYGDWRQMGELLFDHIAPRVQQFGDEVSLTCEVFTGSYPTGRLTFNAEAANIVASALMDLLTTDRSFASACDNQGRALRS